MSYPPNACVFACGREARLASLFCTFCALPQPYQESVWRDAELARKVKAGDLPGKVPEHYASMWDRRRRDGTSL